MLSRLAQLMLSNRGLTESYLSDISCDGHRELLHTDDACSLLRKAFDDKTLVTVLPDFDMDGIMFGVLAFTGLSLMGFRAALYVPDLSDGYGFTEQSVDRLLSIYPDTGLVFTGDVGIQCFGGVRAFKNKGVSVLLTDHHMPSSRLPDADVVVNPLLPEESYEHPRICGAYVGFQILESYACRYCDWSVREQLRRLRVFAGIGTVSDVMPVLYENRSLVKDAVSICRFLYSNGPDGILAESCCGVYSSAMYGLCSVLRFLEQKQVIKSEDDITETLFGFYLAPMFNSVKRMGDDIGLAFRVFFSDTPFDFLDALWDLNSQRKWEVESSFARMLRDDRSHAPFLYISDVRSGLLGLLAQKAIDPGKGPCIVVAQSENGRFHGSGRSPSWYPFLSRAEKSGLNVFAAGHNSAFGIGFSNETELRAFLDFLQKDVESVSASVEPEAPHYDFVIDPHGGGDTDIDISLFYAYLDDLRLLSPFGEGFAKPNILLRIAKGDGDFEVIGSRKNHLKIHLAYGFDVILWNRGQDKDVLERAESLSFTGRLSKSEFRGVESVSFIADSIV